MKEYTNHQFGLFIGKENNPVKRIKISEIQKTEARIAMKEKNPVKALRVLGDILNTIEKNL